MDYPAYWDWLAGETQTPPVPTPNYETNPLLQAIRRRQQVLSNQRAVNAINARRFANRDFGDQRIGTLSPSTPEISSSGEDEAIQKNAERLREAARQRWALYESNPHEFEQANQIRQRAAAANEASSQSALLSQSEQARRDRQVAFANQLAPQSLSYFQPGSDMPNPGVIAGQIDPVTGQRISPEAAQQMAARQVRLQHEAARAGGTLVLDENGQLVLQKAGYSQPAGLAAGEAYVGPEGNRGAIPSRDPAYQVNESMPTDVEGYRQRIRQRANEQYQRMLAETAWKAQATRQRLGMNQPDGSGFLGPDQPGTRHVASAVGEGETISPETRAQINKARLDRAFAPQRPKTPTEIARENLAFAAQEAVRNRAATRGQARQARIAARRQPQMNPMLAALQNYGPQALTALAPYVQANADMQRAMMQFGPNSVAAEEARARTAQAREEAQYRSAQLGLAQRELDLKSQAPPLAQQAKEQAEKMIAQLRMAPVTGKPAQKLPKVDAANLAEDAGLKPEALTDLVSDPNVEIVKNPKTGRWELKNKPLGFFGTIGNSVRGMPLLPMTFPGPLVR